MVKKLLSVLLIVCFVVSSFTACGNKAGKAASGQLIIGNTTEIAGDFVPYFQNGAADYDIGRLTTGYPTVDMTSGGEYVINKTVVKDYETKSNDDGSKTYTFTIKKGLKWNDESEITAADFVTSAMLWSSRLLVTWAQITALLLNTSRAGLILHRETAMFSPELT
jgi:peptide/nickel transport system substrate-binding protein